MRSCSALSLLLTAVLPACFHPHGTMLDPTDATTTDTTLVTASPTSIDASTTTDTTSYNSPTTGSITTCADTSCTSDITSAGACDDTCTTSTAATSTTSVDTTSSETGMDTSTSTTCAEGCAEVRRVFVTASTYTGDLGGAAQADDACNQSAAGLLPPGKFKAWVSDGTSSPWERFDIGFSGDYHLLDQSSTLVVSGGWPALTDGAILQPIDVDELGAKVVVTPYAWTSTQTDGSKLIPNCGDWEVGQVNIFGIVGSVVETDSTWTNADLQPCNAKMRLYCFEDP